MKNDIRGLRLEGLNWIFSYRIAGRSRRMMLGRAPGLVAADARKAAQHFAGIIAVGRDPGAERKAARQAAIMAAKPISDTIERAVASYLKHHKARVRASTYCETTRSFDRNIMPAWHGKRLSEISKHDVRILVGAIARRAPVSGNRCLTSIKAFFTWAVSEDLIPVSPAASVRPPAVEKARERVLDDDELGAVWRASLALGEFGAIIRLLILTGQRRGEIANLSRSEIDFEAKTLNLPASRCKNNRAHTVPLSDAALEVLQWAPPAFECARGMIFTPQSFSAAKVELDKLLPADMPPWTIHDLRRTAASGMAALGVRIETVEKILNHTSGSFRGIVGVYQRHSFSDEKRAALSLWGTHVADLLAVPSLEVAA